MLSAGLEATSSVRLEDEGGLCCVTVARKTVDHLGGPAAPLWSTRSVPLATLTSFMFMMLALAVVVPTHAWAQKAFAAPGLRQTPPPPPTQAPAISPAAQKTAADPRETIAAKRLFGRKRDAAPLPPEAIGFYSRGCLAGGVQLPEDGPAWQAMRLSRNRNWGHPRLVSVVRRLAVDAQKLDGWPGLLVGDLAQPRGGPMLTGHASHQIGLDADIWLTPMPNHRLSHKERERLSATSMLADKLSVNSNIWSLKHVRLIRRAALYPEVERILVHPAIKKALCEGATQIGGSRTWLAKVRPYWGHHYHFHLRIGCPPGSKGCRPQKPPTGAPGCTTELAYWFRLLSRPPAPRTTPRTKPAKKWMPVTLAKLPPACRTVLDAEKIIPPAPVAVRR